MRYFQCSKCKVLKETTDAPELSDIVCDGRRMRELTLVQYNHEVAQRNFIDGGEAPAGTELMASLGI